MIGTISEFLVDRSMVMQCNDFAYCLFKPVTRHCYIVSLGLFGDSFVTFVVTSLELVSVASW